MRTLFQIISFCLIILFAQANIWDNLFLGQGVSFRLPEDFIIELAVEQNFGKVTLELTGSSSLNCLSVNQGVYINDAGALVNFATSTLATYKMNFTAGTLHMNSLLKDCIAVQDDKLETGIYKTIQQYIDIGTLLISREEENGFYKLDAKKIAEMLNVKKIKEINLKDLPLDKIPSKDLPDLPIDKVDLSKLDAEKYADKIPQLVFYFDKQNHNLKRIQVTLPNEENYSLDVISIKPHKSNPQDFALPDSWKCNNQQAKPLHELDFQEMVKDIQEKGGPAFQMASEYLPEGWAIPDLNKLFNQVKDLLEGKSSGSKSGDN